MSTTLVTTSSAHISVSNSKLNFNKNSETFLHMHRNRKHYVQCIAYNKCPNIVKIHSKKLWILKVAQDIDELLDKK